jgi:hypothetical protein
LQDGPALAALCVKTAESRSFDSLARLIDFIKDKISPRLLRELPGRIRDELAGWEIDPARYREEINDLLAYYEEQGLSKSDRNKAKKILTDNDLINRVRGS